MGSDTHPKLEFRSDSFRRIRKGGLERRNEFDGRTSKMKRKSTKKLRTGISMLIGMLCITASLLRGAEGASAPRSKEAVMHNIPINMLMPVRNFFVDFLFIFEVRPSNSFRRSRPPLRIRRKESDRNSNFG